MYRSDTQPAYLGNPDEVRDIGARGAGANIDTLTQQEKESRNIDWIKTVLDPRSFNMLPDQVLENGNSVPNTIDVNMEYPITDPLPRVTTGDPNARAYYAEECPSKTGMFLHFPLRGSASLYHMGFVGLSATPATPVAVPIVSPTSGVGIITAWGSQRGLTSAPNVYNGAPNVATPNRWGGGGGTAINTTDNYGAFQWLGPVVLPRVGNAAIDTGLSVGASFSKTRVYAGIFQLLGNAVSMTAASLTGSASATVVADTRDLASPSGGIDVWSTSSMAQQAISRKDVLKAINLDEGITAIIGDDYQRQFVAPDPAVTRREMGEAYVVTQALNIKSTIWSGLLVSAYNDQVPVAGCSMWITPWACNNWYAVNFTGSLSSPPPNHTLVRIPPIDETGSCKVSVQVPWDAYFTGTAATAGNDVPITAQDLLANVGCECKVLFIHRYCNINDDGTVNYNSRSEILSETRSLAQHQIYQGYYRNLTAKITNVNFPSPVFTSDAGRFRGDFVTQGKYIGTYVQVFFAPSFSPYRPRNTTTPDPGGAGSDYPTGAGYNVNVTMTTPLVEVTATTIDEPGNIGPCHIVRYDNVSNGQTLILKGMFRFQGNPNGTIAPFVQDSIQAAKYVFSSQVQGLLRALFRSNPNFRRIMTTRFYEEVVLPYVRELSAGSLIQESGNKPEVVAHGEQAGLFTTVGSTVGNLFDALAGGAAGQFGLGGGMAGQFGLGGGMAGQYGLGGGMSGRRPYR